MNEQTKFSNLLTENSLELIETERKITGNTKVILQHIKDAALSSEIETILMVRKKPNLDNDWLPYKCRDFRQLYPQGIYSLLSRMLCVLLNTKLCLHCKLSSNTSSLLISYPVN